MLFRTAQKDEKWFKVVAYSIPTATFNNKKGIQLIKDKVYIFNKDFKLATMLQQLTSNTNKQIKKQSSVILAFYTEEEARKVIRKRLQIKGMSIKIASFNSAKLTDQCIKCQSFSYKQDKCSKDLRCKFCAGIYSTKEHKCRLCRTEEKGQKCVHIVLRCVNCKESHEADLRVCSVFKALQPFFSTADPLTQQF